MKLFKLGLLVGSLAISSLTFANSDSEIEAEKLLNSMGMEKTMTASMSQMLDLQMQQNPTLVPFKLVMMKFFNKHMSWDSLKPEFVQIYSEAFTASELRDINAFYATDTGRKTIQKMPTLMAQGAQIGAARVQANIMELQSMIKAEAERLESLSKQ